ncbi:MAG: hypothetical protein HY791_13510 [Deltaproteobacteria bacterium]|nr:hypothetical protein [Deltaproteobacteria bacterium]
MSTVVVGATESGRIRATRVQPRPTQNLLSVIATAESTAHIALGFEQTAEELQLFDDQLTAAPVGALITTTLGEQGPTDRFVLSGSNLTWQSASTDNELERFRYELRAPPPACGITEHQVERINVSTRLFPSSMAAFDEDVLFLVMEPDESVTETDRAFLISRDHEPQLIQLPETGKRNRVAAGAPNQPNRFLMVVGTSTIWRARHELGSVSFEPVGSIPPTIRIRELAASAEDLFAVTSDGVFERWSTDGWVELYRFPVDGEHVTDCSVLVTPGGVVASTPLTPEVAFWDGRELTTRADLAVPGAPSSLGWTPELGLIVADTGGVMSHLDGREFVRLPDSKFRLLVRGIAPTRRGFIFAGARGFVGQFVNGEFCDLESVNGVGIADLQPWGDQLAGYARDRMQPADPTQIVILPAD